MFQTIVVTVIILALLAYNLWYYLQHRTRKNMVIITICSVVIVGYWFNFIYHWL